MHALTLILTDLYLYADDTGLGRLPALETLLARGSLREAGDWRAWSCAQYDIRIQDTVPVAELSRRAHSTPPTARAEERTWLVSPVLLHAELDRVRMDAEGGLSLAPAEWQQLCRGFNETFALDGWQLEPGGERYGFLRSARHLQAVTVDPARCAGRDIRDGLPDGPDGRELRRLMTEAQMWLHSHPLNVASGLPAANALWIWGGGELTAGHEDRELPLLLGDDPFLRGVWSLREGVALSGPDKLPELPGAQAAVATLSVRVAATPVMQRLAALDNAWFGPAWHSLRAGRLRQVSVYLNDRLLTLRSTDRWRFWRRPRPWYEAVR